MKIKNKLKLITIVPTLILVVAATYLFYNTYINYEKARSYKIITNNNKILNKLLIEVGRERGITALYLASNKQSYKELLQNQYKKTDKVIKEYKNRVIISSDTLLPKDYLFNQRINIDKNSYVNLNSKLNRIISIRKLVESTDTENYQTVLARYTREISNPILNNLLQINKFSLNVDINKISNVLTDLYISEEYSGLLRDFLVFNIERKSRLDKERLSEWLNYHSRAMLFDPQLIEDDELSKRVLTFLKNSSADVIKDKNKAIMNPS